MTFYASVKPRSHRFQCRVALCVMLHFVAMYRYSLSVTYRTTGSQWDIVHVVKFARDMRNGVIASHDESVCSLPRRLETWHCSPLTLTAVLLSIDISSVASTRVQGWGDEPPNGVGYGEGNTPPHTGLRLSERRATNIGLLYPKVRNNICLLYTSPSPRD